MTQTAGVRRVAVVTGAASGIGLAIASRLRRDYDVISVDKAEADVTVDLRDPDGRTSAIEAIEKLSGGRLDVVVTAAGVGPTGRQPSDLIAVNFFGAVVMLQGLRPMLANAGQSAAVAISSNTITTHPNPVPDELVQECLDGDQTSVLAKANKTIKSTVAYPVSKVALTRWVRKHAVTPDWIGAGIRLNALAPGMTDTAMLAERRVDPNLSGGISVADVPIGRPLDPLEVADAALFLLGPDARGLCGSVVFCDGGTDALANWETPVPSGTSATR